MRGSSGGGGQTRGWAGVWATGGGEVAQEASTTAVRAGRNRRNGAEALISKIPPHSQENKVAGVNVADIPEVLIFVAKMDLQFADRPVQVNPRRKQILILQAAALLLQAGLGTKAERARRMPVIM